MPACASSPSLDRQGLHQASVRSTAGARALALVMLAVPLFGCDKLLKEAPPVPFDVVVHVESDPGKDLPGASILRNGKELTATGNDGRAKLAIPGNEGEALDFLVKCPPDFMSPQKPISLTLHRNSGGRPPEYTASCPPMVRRVVVAVRAENGANLPVMYLGREVGKTDASGAAHVLLALHPGDQFELALNTDQYKRLHPQNPTSVFVVKPRDDIQPFDVKFTVEKLKAPPPVKHNIPIRVGGTR